MDLLSRSRHAVGFAACLVVAAATPARAQLLSPGKLIAAHADLEGLRNCTKCHELGERGVSRARCLDCHDLLAGRLAQRQGFHATTGDRDCGACHKDHFGADFDAVHLDTAAFAHEKTGYALRGAHGSTACRQCHAPDFITDPAVRQTMQSHGRIALTYLGLGTACATCHAADDPHQGQFDGQGCEDCHAEVDWREPSGFDHAETRYPLRGRHRDTECRLCHTPIPGRRGALQLTGLAFDACAACHAKDDPHAGQFPDRGCDACHAETGWNATDRFDHAATRYPLTGRHRDVACEQCHPATAGGRGSLRLTGIPFAGCESCHRADDPHDGRLGTACKECHGTGGWRAARGAGFERDFDHARTRFPLHGAHATAACGACHTPRGRPEAGIALTFVAATRTRAYPVPVAEQCASCHEDAHAGAFAESPGGPACANCHSDEGWDPTSYDIARHNRDARYRLTGAHLAAPCLACHRNPAIGQETLQFRIVGQDCLACHASLDPHGGQFDARPCDECHVTDSFALPAFDHTRTRYPLDGAHRTVPCASCHPLAPGPDGRRLQVYRPLGTACRDCHQET